VGATAPPEIQGTWHTILDETDPLLANEVELRISEDRYGWTRGAGSHSGEIAVDDGEISFGPNDVCAGPGTYAWSLEGGELTFTAVSPDPCGSRAAILDGQTYPGGG
jgi:hypothetical protein